jgi:hypothetical protein
MIVLSSMPRRRGITKELISWRRNQIAAMLSRGKSIEDCAATLQITNRLVYEDISWIRHNSNKLLRNYLADTLPTELSKCLLRLNQVSNESWTMVDNEKLHARERLAALARAESSAVNIIELLTNNKELVYTALGRKQQTAIESKPSVLSQVPSSSQSSEQGEQQEQENPDDDYVDYDTDYIEQEEEPRREPIEDHEFPSKDFTRDSTEQDPERVF